MLDFPVLSSQSTRVKLQWLERKKIGMKKFWMISELCNLCPFDVCFFNIIFFHFTLFLMPIFMLLSRRMSFILWKNSTRIFPYRKMPLHLFLLNEWKRFCDWVRQKGSKCVHLKWKKCSTLKIVNHLFQLINFQLKKICMKQWKKPFAH